jgi:hypothetical protein
LLLFPTTEGTYFADLDPSSAKRILVSPVAPHRPHPDTNCSVYDAFKVLMGDEVKFEADTPCCLCQSSAVRHDNPLVKVSDRYFLRPDMSCRALLIEMNDFSILTHVFYPLTAISLHDLANNLYVV